MKFLADENIPLQSIRLLRQSDFDIVAIGTDHPGVTDRDVLNIAIQEERTILTFDRDYGELIFKYDYKPDQGLIYFRIFGFEPEEPARVLLRILKLRNLKFKRRITVIEGNTIRQRKY